MADAGKIMVTCEGDYDPERLYDRLCLVNSDDGSYLSKKPVQGIKPTEGEFWQKFDIKMATDNEFSETSINPVQNRVITAKINEMDENIGINAENIETISGEIETLNTDLARQADRGFLGTNNLWSGSVTNLNGISFSNGVFKNTATDTATTFYFRVYAKNSSGSNLKYGGVNINSAGEYSITLDLTEYKNTFDHLQIKHSGDAKDLYFDLNCEYAESLTITIKVNKTNPNSVNGLEFTNLMINSGSSALPYEVPNGLSNRELTEEVSKLEWKQLGDAIVGSGTKNINFDFEELLIVQKYNGNAFEYHIPKIALTSSDVRYRNGAYYNNTTYYGCAIFASLTQITNNNFYSNGTQVLDQTSMAVYYR